MEDKITNAVLAIFTAIGAVLALFLIVCLRTLMGGITAWVIGIFLGDPILHILSQVGIQDVTMFQVGAFLGFITGFFKK